MLISAAAVLFGLVPGSYIVLSIEGVRRSARSLVSALPAIAQLLAGPALLLFIVVAYAASSGLAVVPRLVAYAPYLLIPPLLLARPLRTSDATQQAPLRELAIVFALWLPIEFRVLPPVPLPAPNGNDLQKLVGLVEAMYLFLVVRPLPGIGYTYRLSARDVATALVVFLAYAAVALPIGLATGFIALRPELDATHLVGHPLVIYLAIAVPEEFLFRGLLQNLLTQWLGPRFGLVVASIIFGLAHLPDARYVLLAAIAGVAYGLVYARTQRITASAITHALVDATWGALLRG